MQDFLNILKNLFVYNPTAQISFISGYFLFAFTFLLLIYSFVSHNLKARKWTLIVFNFFFYYKLTGLLCLIILVPILVDFYCAKAIYKTASEKRKQFFMYLSIFCSLGLLIYFKYTNFFLELTNALTGNSFSLLKIAIPVGISFYVFRSICYILDVYNEKIDPVKSFSNYLLYMTFFPLLISGPITRAELFEPQIEDKQLINKDKIKEGLYLVFKGIIKKAIFADYLSLYVALIFNTPEGYTGLENLVGILCFTIQLYLDFSGYTDIAVGISKMLGFDIGINFNEPLKSRSITDFWRRWHISLSEWLRDYLYFPLNYYFRKLRTGGAILAMFITFFICGIWHGTTLLFILFGLLHGLALSWEIFIRKYTIKNSFFKVVAPAFSWTFTFCFIMVTFISMRADSLSSAAGIVSGIFTKMDLSKAILFLTVQGMFSAMLLTSILLIFVPTVFKNKIKAIFLKTPLIGKIALFIIIVQIVVELENQNIVPFIYAQY
jgi:D-alanyl-lipoteichoic acid acyltransferase DltB (MBOAT superfamily)